MPGLIDKHVIGFLYNRQCVCLACPHGFYGSNCKKACSCKKGQPCNFKTGECHCPSGYEGPSCANSKSTSQLDESLVQTILAQILMSKCK